MPGTESQRALDALAKRVPGRPAAPPAPSSSRRPQGRQLATPAEPGRGRGWSPGGRRSCPAWSARVDPFQAGAVSPDGRYALIQVQFADRADEVTDEQRDAYEKVGAAAEAAGLQVEPGGEVLNAEPEVGATEAHRRRWSPRSCWSSRSARWSRPA